MQPFDLIDDDRLGRHPAASSAVGRWHDDQVPSAVA
jgi:hypothetical protein